MAVIKSIKTGKIFKDISLNGEKIVAASIIVLAKPYDNVAGDINLGIIITKKYGNAVARNLAKRRIKSIFFEISKQYQISDKLSYLVIIRHSAKKRSYEKIKKDFKYCLFTLKAIN